jgi:hypothetical protein
MNLKCCLQEQILHFSSTQFIMQHKKINTNQVYFNTIEFQPLDHTFQACNRFENTYCSRLLSGKSAPLSSRYVLNHLTKSAQCHVKSDCITNVKIYSVTKITYVEIEIYKYTKFGLSTPIYISMLHLFIVTKSPHKRKSIIPREILVIFAHENFSIVS